MGELGREEIAPAVLQLPLDHPVALAGVSATWYARVFTLHWLFYFIYTSADVFRLWDSLFADSKRFEFLIYICCAMLT